MKGLDTMSRDVAWSGRRAPTIAPATTKQAAKIAAWRKATSTRSTLDPFGCGAAVSDEGVSVVSAGTERALSAMVISSVLDLGPQAFDPCLGCGPLLVGFGPDLM